MNIRRSIAALSGFEKKLWALSVLLVTAGFIMGGGFSMLTLAASLVGVTSLIFMAKGDVLGQVLMVVFSLMYGLISYGFSYYGEMITYVGMTGPIALLSVVSWIKHPFEGENPQVETAKVTAKGVFLLFILSAAVTVIFYYILGFFGTANLTISTISVFTSFFASSLTYLRTPYYALAYACNDIILIVMWVLASLSNTGYIPVAVCFAVFLANDVYGFINWKKIEKEQKRRLREIVEGGL